MLGATSLLQKAFIASGAFTQKNLTLCLLFILIASLRTFSWILNHVSLCFAILSLSLKNILNKSTLHIPILDMHFLDAFFHIFAPFSLLFWNETNTHSYFREGRNNTSMEDDRKKKELLSECVCNLRASVTGTLSIMSMSLAVTGYRFYASDKWSITVRSVNQREITIGILYRTHE